MFILVVAKCANISAHWGPLFLNIFWGPKHLAGLPLLMVHLWLNKEAAVRNSKSGIFLRSAIFSHSLEVNVTSKIYFSSDKDKTPVERKICAQNMLDL